MPSTICEIICLISNFEGELCIHQEYKVFTKGSVIKNKIFLSSVIGSIIFK